MNIRVIFPLALIVLDLCAALVYGWYKDYAACGYWTCAAVNLGNQFVGIEKESEYANVATTRINEAVNEKKQMLDI